MGAASAVSSGRGALQKTHSSGVQRRWRAPPAGIRAGARQVVVRRERGRCSKEDGMDCVLQFSLPLNTEGGSLLAVGFRDEHLYKAGGVFLRWADENGAQRWDSVDVMRTSSLEPLADEVEASLEMLSGK